MKLIKRNFCILCRRTEENLSGVNLVDHYGNLIKSNTVIVIYGMCEDCELTDEVEGTNYYHAFPFRCFMDLAYMVNYDETRASSILKVDHV